MKNKRWSVYRIVITGTKREAISLGYVNAVHQPAALMAAWKRWPNKGNSQQTQKGFSVIPYVNDHMALGKLNRRRSA